VEISKRITTLRSARSFIDWQRRPDIVRDLEVTRATIVERVGQTRPDLALDLMWRFMALGEPVINRVDDSSGTVGDVFRSACDDIGTLAVKVKPDPHVLAERVLAAVTKNEYVEFDNLVRVIFPALGDIGVAALWAGLTASIPKRPALVDCFPAHAAFPVMQAGRHPHLYFRGNGPAEWRGGSERRGFMGGWAPPLSSRWCRSLGRRPGVTATPEPVG
jgi:hypothetical protein